MNHLLETLLPLYFFNRLKQTTLIQVSKPKTKQFRSPTEISSTYTNQLNYILELKSSQVRSATLESSQFWPPTKNQVIRSPQQKQVDIGQHTVNFDPPHRKQVNVDSNTEMKSISTAHLKSINPHIQKKSLSAPHKKTSQSPIPALKPSRSWTIHGNKLSARKHQNQFRCPPQKQSISIPTL